MTPNLKLLAALFSALLLSSNFITCQAAELNSTLANGLKVMIKEDHRSPLVLVQVWYAVGSTDESEAQLGISHVLEHMMFKGSINVPNDGFKQINAEYGGSLNALTSNTYTYYYQLYPKDYLPLALELEADRMSNLYLRQQDFATEIKVVMEERRQRIEDNPQALAFEKFRYLAYPHSAYRYPVMGTMQNLQHLTLADLQQWYQMWYAPNNATLVIVGDVHPQQTLLQVQRFFGDLKAKPRSAKPTLREKFHSGYRHLDEFANVHVPNLYMAWNVPSLSTADPVNDAYALSLFKNILGNGVSARLERELVRRQKILTTLNVQYDMVTRGDTLFSITAIPSQSTTLKTAQQAIIAVIEQLKTEPLSITELQRAQSMTQAQLRYAQDTLQGQAQRMGSFAINGLGPQLSTSLAEQDQTISAQTLQNVVKHYFTQDNLATLYLQPLAKAKSSTPAAVSRSSATQAPPSEEQ